MSPLKLLSGGHQVGETAFFGWANWLALPFPSRHLLCSLHAFVFLPVWRNGRKAKGGGMGGERGGGTGIKMGIGLHQTNTMEPPFLLEIKSRSRGARTKICITLYGKLGILLSPPPPLLSRRSLLHLPIIHRFESLPTSIIKVIAEKLEEEQDFWSRDREEKPRGRKMHFRKGGRGAEQTSADAGSIFGASSRDRMGVGECFCCCVVS